MRRRTRNLGFLLVLTLAAALVPGAAVFVSPAQASCVPPTGDSGLTALVAQSSIIAVGTVQEVTGGAGDATQSATLHPEVLLKGPSNALDIQIQRSTPNMPCQFAGLQQGDRVLVFLHGAEPFAWPGVSEAYLLSNGQATSMNPADTRTMSETALVAQVRGLTNQVAVPATSNSEGASIDWIGTVVPVTVALLVVFGIGLYLMSIWHRIDPT